MTNTENDESLVKYQIVVREGELEAVIDTMTREVSVSELKKISENGDAEMQEGGPVVGMAVAFKRAIEERIKDLLEVHAPVDLNRHHHHHHGH